jgi:hypothetical protein
MTNPRFSRYRAVLSAKEQKDVSEFTGMTLVQESRGTEREFSCILIRKTTYKSPKFLVT